MSETEKTDLRQMQVQVTYHYGEHRGDHAADVTVAHRYDPDETVADLLARVMGLPMPAFRLLDPTAFVTLRVVTGTEPRVTQEEAPSGGCDPGAIEYVRDDGGPWRRAEPAPGEEADR